MRALIFTLIGISFLCEPAFAKSVRDPKLMFSVKKTGSYKDQITRVFHVGAKGGRYYCSSELTPFHIVEKAEIAKEMVSNANGFVKAHSGYTKGCSQIVMVYVPGKKLGSACVDDSDSTSLLSQIAANCGRK